MAKKKKSAKRHKKWRKGAHVRTMIDGFVYTGVIKTLLSSAALITLDEGGDDIDVPYTALEVLKAEKPVPGDVSKEPESTVTDELSKVLGEDEPEEPLLPENLREPEETPDTPVEPENKGEMSEQLKVALERELRRYVAKKGGFRENLSPARKKVAKRIMARLGREKPEWDHSIITVGSGGGGNPYKEE